MKPTLRRGGRSASVKDLQRLLNALLKPAAGLKVDGIFGQNTDAAVRAFQRQCGLKVDGIVGKNTWGALTAKSPSGKTKGSAAQSAQSVFTMVEAASLAEKVYKFESPSGWKRVGDPKIGSWGFGAALYKKGDITVVAYVGTNDAADGVVDAFMLPQLRLGAGVEALRKLFKRYCVTDLSVRAAMAVLGLVIESYSSSGVARVFFNSVPPQQTRQALAFYKKHKADYVVGHSLGGALAKVVSQECSVPCIAFNSPCMGQMRGFTPQATDLITSVNAHLDPLSFLTREVGNQSHGRVIEKRVFKGKREPKNRWLSFFAYVNPAAAAAEDIAELRYVLDTALHYHGIVTLRKFLQAEKIQKASSNASTA